MIMNKKFEHQFEVRWSDVDANQHLRHSAYSDFACQARVRIFNEIGLTYPVLQEKQLGPVLFHEAIKFLSEIGLAQNVRVFTKLYKSEAHGRKWSFIHQIFKEDGILAADMISEGGFMDVGSRKIIPLPDDLLKKWHLLKYNPKPEF
jgi:acyl-CoA thioester hydrolase